LKGKYKENIVTYISSMEEDDMNFIDGEDLLRIDSEENKSNYKLDTVLRYLASTFGKGGVEFDVLLRRCLQNRSVIDGDELILILHKLIKDTYITSSDKIISKLEDNFSGVVTVTYYRITFEGKFFLLNNGYTEQKRKRDQERIRQRKREDLQDKNIQSVIDTNESLKELNTETRWYYQQQDLTNKSVVELNSKTKSYYTQLKWATWIIAIATIFTMISSILTYRATSTKPPQLDTGTLRLIEELMKMQKSIETPLQMGVKDTFVLKVYH
jgi:hypothetical protein